MANSPESIGTDVGSKGRRVIAVRQGVGAAGVNLQRANLTSHGLVTTSPSLVLVKHGIKIIRCAEGEFTAKAGDVVALASGQTMDITNLIADTSDYQAFWIAWDDSVVQDFAKGRSQVRAPFRAVQVISQVNAAFVASHDAALSAIRDKESISDAVARHRLVELLLWLEEHGSVFSPAILATTRSQVRQLFASDPSRDWRVEDVGAHLSLSSATLRRRLACDAINFRELLQDVRMSQALVMLQSTDSSVIENAMGVGYYSSSRFAVRFRSRFGFSPSQVRGQRRGYSK